MRSMVNNYYNNINNVNSAYIEYFILSFLINTNFLDFSNLYKILPQY